MARVQAIGWKRVAFLGAVLALAACSRETPQAASEAPVQGASVQLAAAPPAPPAPVDLSGGQAPGFPVYEVLAPDRQIEFGDYAWNPEGAPNAPTRIVVDVEAEKLYAYRGGVEIGRAVILYGADDKPTPLGTFPILQKKKDHVSNLYDAEMPYMMRLTMDGIAIHGSDVEEGYATHGCIGIPEEFAALLFGQAKVGDKVLITKGWMRGAYEEDRAPDAEATA